MPATSAYLTVLRTTTASLAARLEFTLDDIEDLRMGVDEACAVLLQLATPDSELQCQFDLLSNGLDIHVSVPTADPELPGRESFAWTVLTALVGDVDATTDGDQVTITLRKKRG